MHTFLPTVSYTHLDVYKRQPMKRPRLVVESVMPSSSMLSLIHIFSTFKKCSRSVSISSWIPSSISLNAFANSLLLNVASAHPLHYRFFLQICKSSSRIRSSLWESRIFSMSPVSSYWQPSTKVSERRRQWANPCNFITGTGVNRYCAVRILTV